MNRHLSLTVLAVALMAACESKPKDQTPPAADTAATAPATAATAPAATAAPVAVNTEQAVLDEVPVPADFEEQASTEITRENLDTQVAALEKELSQ